MTFKRNIPLDIETTQRVLMECQETKQLPEKSWLGHEQGNAQIDIKLVQGATLEELAEASGRVPSAVNAHLYHLRKEHGLTVDREDGLLRFAPLQSHAPTPPSRKQAAIESMDETTKLDFSNETGPGISDDASVDSILNDMRQLQKRVGERLEAIQIRIAEIEAERAALVEERKKLMFFANGETPSEDLARPSGRQPRGALKDACLEAIDASPDGFTSSEVVAWLEQNRPDIMPKSAPAVLSRLATDGDVFRDPRGVYRRTASKL